MSGQIKKQSPFQKLLKKIKKGKGKRRKTSQTRDPEYKRGKITKVREASMVLKRWKTAQISKEPPLAFSLANISVIFLTEFWELRITLKNERVL